MSCFWPIAKITAGLGLMVVGGESLVRGASGLATAMRISPLVIGLTVVAFGTSSPELAVAVQSAYSGSATIALGNVVGSNIINILFILGLSAMIIPLHVSSQLIRRDVPLMVAASVVLLLLGLDGTISRVDGIFLTVGLVVYVIWTIRTGRVDNAEVQEEFEHELPQVRAGRWSLGIQTGLMVGGLVLLALGSRWLVGGSVSVATHLGVSELVIGLTIVAAGTSLPEVVISIMAAWRGEREIAVGNVVGSNLLNILCVLGISGVVAPAGIGVPRTALEFDIPVMIAVSAACLPVFFTGHVIARWEGGLFFFYYVAYTSYLLLDAVENEISRTVGGVMVVFVIPLTVITLMIAVYRAVRARSVAGDDPAESD